MLGCWLTAAAGRPKVGLVLGGGGAKGAAEVGVIKVLERAGIPIDYIAGTSMGSIVGGLYAAGYTSAELDTMFCRQEWLSLITDRRSDLGNEPYKVKNGVTYIFGFPVMGDVSEGDIGGFGVMRGERVEQVIDSMATSKGCRDFKSLHIPARQSRRHEAGRRRHAQQPACRCCQEDGRRHHHCRRPDAERADGQDARLRLQYD